MKRPDDYWLELNKKQMRHDWLADSIVLVWVAIVLGAAAVGLILVM